MTKIDLLHGDCLELMKDICDRKGKNESLHSRTDDRATTIQ